jgi:hypothetical protein
MNPAPPSLPSATRPVDPALSALLRGLRAGQRIRLTQRVRVGRAEWTTTALGTFRGLSYLCTGLSTERVPEDDIVVPLVHFTKDNGELSSITIDEHSQVELVAGG